MASAGKRPIEDEVDEGISVTDPIKRHRAAAIGFERDSEEAGLRLVQLLLRCAECLAVDNLLDASQILPEILELSSPFGSSVQRVGAYFADAISSRVIACYVIGKSPVPCLPTLPLSLWKSHYQKLLAAFQTYNSITPMIKFSHFTANQAIQQAVDGADHVHVIDLDIMQGLQWPGFFQILASKPRKLKSLRITGLGPSLDLLDSTGLRLAEFAGAVNIPFHFHAVEGKIGNITEIDQLKVRIGETVIVHWMHHSLYDMTGSDLGVFRLLKMIKPKLITIVERTYDLSNSGEGGFLRRFIGALHYYSALFDALGDVSAPESLDRHTVEQQLFGCEIRNILSLKKRDGEVEMWGKAMAGLGFRRVSLGGNASAQASLLLGMMPWRGYTLVEENGWLKMGWKNSPLLTASAWETPDLPP